MAHTLTHRNIQTHHKTYEDDADNTHEHAVVNRQLLRSEFGGFHLGAAFFGWLVATGLGAILVAILAAAGSAIAVASIGKVTTQTTNTVGLVSGILLLVALAVSYYAGGYVAGRLSRFNGARQGFGTWVIGIIITLILGALGAAFGSKYNIVQQMNLPHLPINQGTLTTGGWIASLAAIVVTLIAAILGGKQGEHYHNRIDEAGQVDTVDL